MSFHSPHLLWLLAPLVLLFSWELARHTTRAVSSWPKIARAWAGAFEVSLGARHTTADTRPRVWLWFGLALCIIALARPQWGVIEEQVFDQSREVLIAVDLSKSMLAQDVKPSRLDRSKLLIQSLLDGLKGERVGLVMFAGTAFLQSPLSADYEILREFLPSMNPDYLPEGGSNYKALLETSIQAFGTSAADRYLIILSDGESTTEDWKPLAESLKTKGIRVIGLGIGTAQGSFIPDASGGFIKDERGAVVMSRLNSATLQELAQLTRGAYTDASGWVDLPALLAKTVEAGQKGEFAEKNTARLIERFQWFLAPGLILLLVSFWTEFPVRPRERAIPLANRAPGKPKGAVAGIFIAGLLLGLGGVSPRAQAQAPLPDLTQQQAKDNQTTEEVFTAPLRKKVIELATKEDVSAKDFASFADTTVTFGKRLTASKLPVPEKPITDALLAVDQGEKLDAKAGDWPRVRKELEALLKKDEKSEEQKKQDEDKQKQDQQNKDQQKSSQDKQEQNQQKQDQNKDQQNSDQQQKQDQQNQSGEEKENQEKESQEAFGDMKEPEQKKEPKKQPPQPQSGTQKVGGQQEKKPEGEAMDPNLAIPLQKLDQVRNQDSPAKLQQIIQGQQKQPAAKGKDW